MNYSIFVAAFAALTHLYLFPATLVDTIASPLAMAALDFLDAVFFLCAGIAMAAQLGGRPCSGYVCICPCVCGGGGGRADEVGV